jgi:hypothetical protein
MRGPPIDSLAALLRYCQDFSKQMLVEAGEFHPFGAFINAEGTLEALGAHLGTEFPKGAELYAFIQDALCEFVKQEKAIAFAIAANVTVPESFAAPFTDGMRVHVAAPGYSRMIYTPYRVLSYRALRRFLAVLPVVEYAEPISVEVKSHDCFASEG